MRESSTSGFWVDTARMVGAFLAIDGKEPTEDNALSYPDFELSVEAIGRANAMRALVDGHEEATDE